MKKLAFSAVLLLFLCACGETHVTIKPPPPVNTGVFGYEAETWHEGGCMIEYPVLIGIESDTMETLNSSLKADALAVLDTYDFSGDGASYSGTFGAFTSNEGILSVAYNGSYAQSVASEPVEVFYAGNYDIETGLRLKLSDLADIDKIQSAVKAGIGYYRPETEGDEGAWKAQIDYIKTALGGALSEKLAAAGFGGQPEEPISDICFYWGDGQRFLLGIRVSAEQGDVAYVEFEKSEYAKADGK